MEEKVARGQVGDVVDRHAVVAAEVDKAAVGGIVVVSVHGPDVQIPEGLDTFDPVQLDEVLLPFEIVDGILSIALAEDESVAAARAVALLEITPHPVRGSRGADETVIPSRDALFAHAGVAN